MLRNHLTDDMARLKIQYYEKALRTELTNSNIVYTMFESSNITWELDSSGLKVDSIYSILYLGTETVQ